MTDTPLDDTDFTVETVPDRVGHALHRGDLVYVAVGNAVEIGRIIDIDLYLGIEVERIENPACKTHPSVMQNTSFTSAVTTRT